MKRNWVLMSNWSDGTSGFITGTLVHAKEGLIPIELVKFGDSVMSQAKVDGEQTRIVPI